MPLGYLGDEAKTVATFPTVEGVRHAIAGDRARLVGTADRPVIELAGRDSVTINTGGEKVFAEEVEPTLAAHPAVFDVVVCAPETEQVGAVSITALVSPLTKPL